MGLQARFVETQHARVAISETDGTGHPVLLIHGNSSCRQVFRHQLEGGLGNRYRMIAMDLPGHGDSENARDPQESYTQPAYAEAAVDVLRACGAENAVILGWSLGGHIGIELISRLPDMRALTFSGTPPTGPVAPEKVTKSLSAAPWFVSLTVTVVEPETTSKGSVPSVTDRRIGVMSLYALPSTT